MSGVDIRDAIATAALPPIVPGRLRKPLIHVVPDAMPAEWTAEVGRWLFAHRLEGSGDDFDVRAPHLTAPLRTALLRLLPDALGPCGVADFDLDRIEIIAAMHHHGGGSGWFCGLDGPTDWARRRIGFELALRTDPRMFVGGELEMLSGETVDPDNARLCWLHPIQAVRIREVECWSADPMHGRWSIWGWLHGPVPAGWCALVERWRETTT